MKWLLLITSLSTDNGTVRMRAWRALKASGAAVLRDGVYLIPATGDTRTVLARVEQDIEASGGSAWLLNVGDADYPFAALFDRTADYNELAEDITKCRDALKAEPGPALARRVRKLRNAYESLAAIDFFPEEARRQTGDRLDALERQLAGAQSSDEPTGTSGAVKRRKAARYQGRLWATRKRMWVDRMGSAWLIRRFIDPQARFAWLDSPDDCPRDALGFDFDGATFSHVETPGGLLVTFETLIESFGLHEDAALRRLAQIVHCLDVGGLTVAEAAGLERILSGIRARTRNDDSLLKAAGRVFDDLYLAFQHEAEPA